MTNVYIAARDLERARQLRDRVNAIEGAQCCASWIDKADPARFGKSQFGKIQTYTDDERMRQARSCFLDVTIASVFVSLAAEGLGKGGRHVELGIALAGAALLGTPEILHVGKRENVFHWHPDVEVLESDDAFIERLEKFVQGA